HSDQYCLHCYCLHYYCLSKNWPSQIVITDSFLLSFQGFSNIGTYREERENIPSTCRLLMRVKVLLVGSNNQTILHMMDLRNVSMNSRELFQTIPNSAYHRYVNTLLTNIPMFPCAPTIAFDPTLIAMGICPLCLENRKFHHTSRPNRRRAKTDRKSTRLNSSHVKIS